MESVRHSPHRFALTFTSEVSERPLHVDEAERLVVARDQQAGLALAEGPGGIVIAQANPRMPFTFGDAMLHETDVDYLVVESTYGDRHHDMEDALARFATQTASAFLRERRDGGEVRCHRADETLWESS